MKDWQHSTLLRFKQRRCLAQANTCGTERGFLGHPVPPMLTHHWGEGGVQGSAARGGLSCYRVQGPTAPVLYFSLNSSLEIRMSCPGGNKTARLINLRYLDQDGLSPVTQETLKSSRALSSSSSIILGMGSWIQDKFWSDWL